MFKLRFIFIFFLAGQPRHFGLALKPLPLKESEPVLIKIWDLQRQRKRAAARRVVVTCCHSVLPGSSPVCVRDAPVVPANAGHPSYSTEEEVRGGGVGGDSM
jgi:hypothetical protein